MEWHRNENQRSLPWKQENDPYKIWLSEIILQQTRAGQGLPYYLRFVKAYPTIQQLANASDEEVFRLWQGLGYYNRCKNLLHTARKISKELNGIFPSTFEEIKELKGVGDYTAAAIASFAFHLPYAVVDGNVNRVLARFFGVNIPCDSVEGKKTFQSLAAELLDKKNSAAYNQAIMDHGATVCTPLAPRCKECALQEKCIALKQNLIGLLPVKSKKTEVKKRFFHYFLLTSDHHELFIKKRTGKDIWQNLYEPLLIEHSKALNLAQLEKQSFFHSLDISGAAYEGMHSQRLTHQLIETRFFSLCVNDDIKPLIPSGEWVPFNQLKKFPFPKTIVSFFEKKFYF